MILLEKAIYEDAISIENAIIDKINNAGFSKGSFNATDLFKKVLKRKKKEIFVHYNLEAKHYKAQVEVTDFSNKKITIILDFKKNQSMKDIVNSINHEVMHVISGIKSNFKFLYSRKKNFDKYVDDKNVDRLNYQLSYFKDKEEFNVTINQILDNYHNNVYFRKKVNNMNSLDEFIQYIFKYIDLGYISKEAYKDINFRKMFLRRLYREGIILPFFKKQMFEDKVKERIK